MKRQGNLTPGELIGALIAVVIGVSLYPVVNDTVASVGATGTAGTLLDLIPLLFVIGVVVSSIAFLRLRQMGGTRQMR